MCGEGGREGRDDCPRSDRIHTQYGGPEGQSIEIDIGNPSIQSLTIEIHRRLLSIDIDNR